MAGAWGRRRCRRRQSSGTWNIRRSAARADIFDIVHIATIAAALLAAVSQVIDMVCLQRNQAAWGALTGARSGDRAVRRAALLWRGLHAHGDRRGAVGARDLQDRGLRPGTLRARPRQLRREALVPARHHLRLRGALRARSSRRYDDDTSGAAAAAGGGSGTFDDPRAMTVIHCSGTVLMATGFLCGSWASAGAASSSRTWPATCESTEGPRRPHGRGQRKR